MSGQTKRYRHRVRTVHHYDAIGLLKPAKVTGAGYRLYDDAALKRLQSILLYRELQFPLKEIKIILDSPAFDPKEALTQQIALLEGTPRGPHCLCTKNSNKRSNRNGFSNF